MSATIEAPARPRTSDAAPASRERGCTGGRRTLEATVSGAWEGILAAGTADCPLCRGRMERHGDAGRCTACGTSLF